MDKYEYKIKSEEIKELIAQREFARAAEIADTIDWRRVKSVMMLCTISDLYKMNRRYEDSRDLLLLAYDRHPGGRTIVYALSELSIKTGEIPQAVEYCKEFVNIAPRDPGRYILQYKIYEAQGVGLEERIEVLEELKKHDYREKWAYELAYLYHRIGLASKCVDECDEMIVWFGDGKYVIKAMELKMLHQPLTPDQQYKYDRRFAPVVEEMPVEETNEDATVMEEIPQEMYAPADASEEEVSGSTAIWSGQDVAVAMEPLGIDTEATKRFPIEEINIQVKTMDPGNEYNTINLQAELAAGLKEVLENEKAASNEEITRAIVAPMMQTDNIDREEVTKILQMPVVPEESEVTTQEAEALEQEPTIIWNKEEVMAETENIEQEETDTEEEVSAEEVPAEEDVAEEELLGDTEEIHVISQEPAVEEVPEQESATTGQQVMEQMRRETVEPPKEMAKVLSMEGDGQLTFLMEEKNAVEQQITGQLSIEDIMAEWERMKKELEEKGKEKVRQHVKENTGQMFTEFEASIRDGLLEQLEGGRSIDAVIAEAEGRSYEEEEELPVPESLLEEEEEPAREDYEETVLEEAEDVAEVPLTTEDVVEELEEIQEVVEVIPEESEEVFEVEEFTEYTEESETGEFTEESGAEEIEEFVEESEAEETEEFVEESEAEETEEYVEEPEAEETEEFVEESEAEETEEYVEESEAEETEEFVEESEAEGAEEIYEDIPEEASGEVYKARNLTREERELFAPYIQGRSSKEQLVKALDNVSMAAYTGNVIITGAEGLDTLGLARSIVQDIQSADSNFSGKSAKISGEALNKRNVNEILGGLQNGALIIQRAHNMNDQTAEDLYKALQQENNGIIVVMEGVRKPMDAFLDRNDKLRDCFTARMDMEALSDAALVAFCKRYAKENEFVLDELAVLALHQIITDRQTNDHAVTIMEVKEIMEDAFDNASRKSIGHFFDILTGKRYDEEDMIVIHEKDLM
ncbi:MAG: hypothetical protein J6L65_08175 [Lachnospiraceae bacterium]|nr:hypothetical protein [Lachnospiraceae bacterium]